MEGWSTDARKHFSEIWSDVIVYLCELYPWSIPASANAATGLSFNFSFICMREFHLLCWNMSQLSQDFSCQTVSVCLPYVVTEICLLLTTGFHFLHKLLKRHKEKFQPYDLMRRVTAELQMIITDLWRIFFINCKVVLPIK